MQTPPRPTIEIRPLIDHVDLDAAVQLQRDVWSYGDLDVESRSILTVASRFAGQVLGAFDGSRMVGFSLAFAAREPGRLHSHRVGVLRDYQNLGVGRLLKLAQRANALELGIPVMQWTFDPLQTRNAYFNLTKLGGISRRYISNLYGITSSPLHGGLPTDRLLIEWELTSERVRRTIAGEALQRGAETLEIPLPTDPERKTIAGQAALRNRLTNAFAEGFILTGLRSEGSSHTYLLERN